MNLRCFELERLMLFGAKCITDVEQPRLGFKCHSQSDAVWKICFIDGVVFRMNEPKVTKHEKVRVQRKKIAGFHTQYTIRVDVHTAFIESAE